MFYGKVEICGVNTADLRSLTDAEKRDLLCRVANGDSAAREQMIDGNLRLVLSIVQRFASRGENPDDLFQVGCIGLMKAIDHFNTDLDVKFSTYAVPMNIPRGKRKIRSTTDGEEAGSFQRQYKNAFFTNKTNDFCIIKLFLVYAEHSC